MKKKFIFYRQILKIISLLVVNSAFAYAKPAYINIIIDDMGYLPQRDLQVIQLPGAITCSIIPYSEYGKIIARQAHSKGKQIIAHVPMQACHQHYLAPGALTVKQSSLQLKMQLMHDLQAVPYAQGLSNHEGSLLTQRWVSMMAIMQIAHLRGFFFIDSRTTPHTVAETFAELNQVPVLRRNVFLDDVPREPAIAYQFQQLLDIARQQGMAIAIGHPYPATIAYLRNEIPHLAEDNVKLVPLSQLVEDHQVLLHLEGKILPGENLTCINPESCLE